MATPSTVAGSRRIAATIRDHSERGTAAARLREADSRIEVAIKEIDRDVDCDEEQRDDEHGALHERVVALQDRVQQHPAHTRDGEDLLDHDGASEQIPDL